MNVIDAIKQRRSYRGAYENIKVPREDLKKILEAGLSAPSGCNKQTTSFIAVDDMNVLEKLYEVMELPEDRRSPAMICVLTQKIIAYNDRCFNIQDYSAAIENILLAATDMGYKSCWIEGQITDEDDGIGKKMADVLGVPGDYELVCFIPIGIAKEEIKDIDKKAFDERAWFNGFKNK